MSTQCNIHVDGLDDVIVWYSDGYPECEKKYLGEVFKQAVDKAGNRKDLIPDLVIASLVRDCDGYFQSLSHEGVARPSYEYHFDPKTGKIKVLK